MERKTHQVDIGGLEFLQARFDRVIQTFGGVARGVGLDLLRGTRIALETDAELGSKDDLLADAPLGHPFANPGLGLFVLIVVRAEALL